MSLPEQPAYPLEFAAQFWHAGRSKGSIFEPTREAADAHARMLGATPEAWNAQLAEFAERTRGAARELAAEGVTHPFGADDRVLALGDSITDDAQSWAEILRHLDVDVVNAGVSGATSTDVLLSAGILPAVQATTVVVMVGTNDSIRMGHETKTLVSDAETEANLRAFGDLVLAEPGVRLVWMTPPPAHDALIAQNEPFTGVRLAHGDVLRKAEIVRWLPGTTVDLSETFGDPPADELFLPDGIHPSLAGQKETVRALLRAL